MKINVNISTEYASVKRCKLIHNELNVVSIHVDNYL